jgi:hypothetical protein
LAAAPLHQRQQISVKSNHFQGSRWLANSSIS